MLEVIRVPDNSSTTAKLVTVGLLCHDFRPDSGRGVDRYSFYLGTNISRYVNLHLVQVGKIRRYPRDWIPKVWRYSLATRRTKADVFHATSYLDASNAVLTKRHPLVTTIHDLLPFKSSEKYYHPTRSPARDLYQATCLRTSSWSDLIITPFKAYVEDIVTELKFPPERIKQVYYGVDHDLFRPKILGERKGPKRILYLGGINQEKGIFELVFAFRELRKSFDNISLVIAGRGPHQSRLSRILDEMELANSVEMLGFVPEPSLPQIYKSADLVAIPSKTGFNLMSLEAMSCGTPALVGDTPDNREIVGDGRLRCMPGEHEQIASKIFDILSDESTLYRLSEYALSVAARYSWERMARETCTAYSAVLNSVPASHI